MANNEQDNGVFCVMPWTHLAVKTTGDVRPCSWVIEELRMEDGSPYRVQDHGVGNHEQNFPIEQLKSNMLNGTPSKVCQRCYEQEKLNGISKRTVETWQTQWHKTQEILETGNTSISQLELRLGNKCNLGCITCDPLSSTYIVKELDRSHNHDLSDVDPRYYRKYKGVKDLNLNWYEDPQFWQDLEPILPNLDYIYIAGGEPTIIKENWEFLQRLVDLDLAKNITIGISTNLTSVQQKHIEIYKQFKHVMIYASLDAYGSVNDYIRYPSQWEKVNSNFQFLASNLTDTNIELMIMPVLSIFNIWRINELWDWAMEARDRTNSNITIKCHAILRDPQHQSLYHMPDSMKQKAIDLVNEIKTVHKDPHNQDHLKRITDYLENALGKGDLDTFLRGQKHTETMDNIRGIYWQDYVPELKEGWS